MSQDSDELRQRLEAAERERDEAREQLAALQAKLHGREVVGPMRLEDGTCGWCGEKCTKDRCDCDPVICHGFDLVASGSSSSTTETEGGE